MKRLLTFIGLHDVAFQKREVKADSVLEKFAAIHFRLYLPLSFLKYSEGRTH
jgi:hypothetical protein